MAARIRAAVALTVVALGLSACTGTGPSAGQTSRAEVPLHGGSARAAAGGWQVAVSQAPGRGDLDISPAALPPARLPAATRLDPHPAALALTGTVALPPTGAHLSRALPAPVPAGTGVTLAYWDPARRLWVGVPSTLSTDRRTVQATVHHFSIWDLVYYALAELGTKRVDAPSCEDSLPQWVDGLAYQDDLNSPLRWCISWDADDHSQLLVKVANNRAYGFTLHTATPPLSVENTLNTQDLGIKDHLDAALRSPLLVLPGQEVDLRFNQAQVHGAPEPLISAEADPVSVAVGWLYEVASQGLAPADPELDKAFALLDAQQCMNDIAHAADPAAADSELANCLVDQRDHVLDVVRSSAIGVDLSGADAASFAAGAQVLAALGAFKMIGPAAEATSDLGLYPNAFQLTVYLHPGQAPLPSTPTVTGLPAGWSVLPGTTQTRASEPATVRLTYPGTYWGGAWAPNPQGCNLTVTARARLRDTGGYWGYGLAVLARSPAAGAFLGRGLQYDAGAGGYQDAQYQGAPTDAGDTSAARLDTNWHTLALAVHGGTYKMSVDARPTATGAWRGPCAAIAVRVWNGATVDLAGVTVQP